MTTTSEPDSATAGDDWLEQALRADARDHAAAHVDDDGFTARVMAALPEPAALPAWRKRAVATMWTLAAAGGVVAFPDVALDGVREAYRFLVQPTALAQVAVALAAIGTAMWGGAAWLLKND